MRQQMVYHIMTLFCFTAANFIVGCSKNLNVLSGPQTVSEHPIESLQNDRIVHDQWFPFNVNIAPQATSRINTEFAHITRFN